MSALPVNVVEFQLPKRKPKIIEKAGNPDQRTYAVVPLRALRDKRLTSGDIRVLGIMASYANRAGLTWVGQRRMGEDLQVSQQAISKHVKRLTELGYLEMVSNAFRGEKAVTRRIIFDDTIKAVDAVAITSSIEDTRSPEMVKKDTREAATPLADDGLPEMSAERIEANKKRLREMLATMGGSPNFRTHQPQRIGDLMPRVKKSHTQPPMVVHGQPSHAQPSMVVNEGSHAQLHAQPYAQPQSCANMKNIGIEEVLKTLELHVVKDSVCTTITDTDMKAIELLVEVGCNQADLEAHLAAADLSKGVAPVLCDLIDARS
jgi:DNA-binding transcriptional ArsR family regulator